jgi:hypothetical protein
MPYISLEEASIKYQKSKSMLRNLKRSGKIETQLVDGFLHLNDDQLSQIYSEIPTGQVSEIPTNHESERQLEIIESNIDMIEWLKSKLDEQTQLTNQAQSLNYRTWQEFEREKEKNILLEQNKKLLLTNIEESESKLKDLESEKARINLESKNKPRFWNLLGFSKR